MKIKIISAINELNFIGKDGKLIANIKEDIEYFKKMTMNHTVVMGRKTMESLPRFPLPHRDNLVMTRTRKNDYDVTTAEEAISRANGDLWVIGGEEIYKMFIPYCNQVYLNVIKGNKEVGDTHFPLMDVLSAGFNVSKVEETDKIKYLVLEK